jgi:hypothetical protein
LTMYLMIVPSQRERGVSKNACRQASPRSYQKN